MKNFIKQGSMLCLGVFLLSGRNANAQAVVDTFKFTNSIVSFKVPNGVTSMTIQALGAQGGDGLTPSVSPGGHGANLTGTFSVTSGNVLKILVGQKPAPILSGGANAGGGGSFVWDSTNSNNLLMAAGAGGGGCTYNANPPGIDADLADSGTMGTADGTYNGSPYLAPGGQGGNGGGSLWEGSGGTGWLTNGVSGNGFCSQTYGGMTPLNGGQGGAGTSGNGGFGGGGGAGHCWYSAGGGGGYSGGSGSGATEGGGGGGGSFNGGTSQNNFVRPDTGNGMVIVTFSVPQRTDTLKYNDSIRYWKVPCGVTQITITAIGGTGGQMIGNTPVGGKGAKLTGTFTVTPDSTLKILVGGAGQDGSGGGGGGGGSFVTDIQNNPLIIAGGGGGVAGDNSFTSIRIDATAADSGLTGNSQLGNSPSQYGIGGRNGNGATNAVAGGPCAGNGGGLLTDGQGYVCCSSIDQGLAFVNGGAGGIDGGCSNDGVGGFGGGGAGGGTGGGGGGGYSGGGGSWDFPTNGAGAGSFNGGTSQVNVDAFNASGNGLVLLTYSKFSVSGNLIAQQSSGCNGSASAVLSGGVAPYTYLWTGGATTDTISNVCAGTYCVKVTDHNGCMDSTCVTINDITGIKKISNAASISIYPDPTKGYFTISGITKGQVVKVYNYLGEEISSRVADNSNLKYDITDKPNGIYLVRIQKADGTLVTEKKIIKAQ